MPTDENRRLHRETLRMSARYAQFNELLSKILAYLPDNAGRLKIPDSQVAELTETQRQWAPAYAAYMDPNQRTRAVIMDMEKRFKAADAPVRALQQGLKNNPNITLTGDDHTALGVHVDKTTRTPVPVQTVAPLVEAYEMRHMETKFRTSYPDSAGDFHRRLPAYNSILIKTAFTAADAPAPAAADYDHITMSGRSRFTVVAPPNTPVGSHGYVKCAYVNSRGEAGPDSEALMFLVN